MNIKKLLKGFSIIFLGLAFIYYFYTNNPTKSEGIFLRCPSNLILGLNCPGCGSQRAIHYILHFNFIEAFKYNSLLVVSLPFVIYITAVWLYNIVFDKKVRIKLLYNNTFVYSIFTIIVLFGILRNIPYYPFNLLAP